MLGASWGLDSGGDIFSTHINEFSYNQHFDLLSNLN